jgi:hypothetical protein
MRAVVLLIPADGPIPPWWLLSSPPSRPGNNPTEVSAYQPHGSHSTTAFPYRNHLRARFGSQRVAGPRTVGLCQKGKLVSNGCGDKSYGADGRACWALAADTS